MAQVVTVYHFNVMISIIWHGLCSHLISNSQLTAMGDFGASGPTRTTFCWWDTFFLHCVHSIRLYLHHFLAHIIFCNSALTWSAPFFFFFFLPQQPELSPSRPLASQSRPSSSSNPPCWPWDVSAAKRYDRFLRMQTQFSTVWRWRELGEMKDEAR